MRKIFTFFAAMAVSVSAFATTFTFSGEADLNQTKDGISVAVAKGSGNNAPAFYDNGLRLYASNTITVSGADLKNMKITFAKQGQKDYATLTASAGSLVSGGTSTGATDPVTDTWTGTASSVTFTLGTGQRLLVQLVVNGDGSETIPEGPGTDPGTPDTPSDLNPDYNYSEPTVVTVQGKTVQGDAYSFVSNNVLVSCTKGAVTDTYFSAHAGFDMTFTATRPIKGISINGMVKKNFEATSNHGKITFISPDEDTDADPCVMITDVDATSVTISCVKQLRCYSVELYFDENPDGSMSGGSGSGEEIALSFDGADVVYEKEYSEMVEEANYSIYLYDMADPYALDYFALDIYPEKEGDITGTYTWLDWTLGDYTYYVWGEGDDDMAWAEDGTVTITKNGNVYSIKGTVLCDNGNTYTIKYSGEPEFYVDEDYYEGEGDDGDDSAVDTVVVENSGADAPAYDLQGRKVSKTFRGIVVKAGRKQVQR